MLPYVLDFGGKHPVFLSVKIVGENTYVSPPYGCLLGVTLSNFLVTLQLLFGMLLLAMLRE